MEWEKLLDHYGSLIEGKLESYFSYVIKNAKNYHPFIGELYENIREFSLRKGKRLLPAVLYYLTRDIQEK